MANAKTQNKTTEPKVVTEAPKFPTEIVDLPSKGFFYDEEICNESPCIFYLSCIVDLLCWWVLGIFCFSPHEIYF